MSFPGSFGSQLTAIMEALLKAVVAEVTALVEDGAVELRLELRDREQQILEKERDIEERDRVIEELRAAVEELMDRREEAVSPEEEEEEDRQEQNQSCEQEHWTKDEEAEAIKHEPTEEFAAAVSKNLHETPLSPTVELKTNTCDDSWSDAKQETTQSSSQRSPQTEDFSQFLPLDSLLNMSQERFDTMQPGFSLVLDPAHERESVHNAGGRKRRLNVGSHLDFGGYRCEQCGKTFTVKWRLMTHQSVHTGAKPYSCRKCGMKFSRRDNCVRHEKSDVRCINSPGKGFKGTIQDLKC